MRSLADDDGKRVKLVWGAMALLVWAALLLALWALLDWCDDRIPLWAGYLNSRASAGGRATLFTYAHLQLWFTDIEWLLRWIVIPAKLIPHAIASAQWGWRLPLRRIIRLLAELAMVVGCGRGGVCRRVAARALFQGPSKWNSIAPGLGRSLQGRWSVFAAGCRMGSPACVGCSTAGAA